MFMVIIYLTIFKKIFELIILVSFPRLSNVHIKLFIVLSEIASLFI